MNQTTVGALSDLAGLGAALGAHAPWPLAALEGPTHTVRHANAAFCRLLDQTLDGLIGRPLATLLPAGDRCLTTLGRVWRTAQAEGHHPGPPPAPRSRLGAYVAWPVVTGEASVGVMLQVTEVAGFPAKVVAMNEALLLGSLRQHELAAAAGRANTELHMEVAGRQRTEAALQSALADAETARQAKDHFLAVSSHELRTPLTPVLMATHALARRRDLPPAVTEALEMISRNVQLEAHFIDDLLDLTRIEHGKLELVRAPMDLHEAIRRALEVSEGDLHAKGQTLTVALHAPAHRLEGDSNRLQQVFWNLLKNAAKFTPEGGAVTVRSRLAEVDGERISVEVSDNGIGIEPGALARIFDPFEQANVEITRQFGGLGLGLAIAQATVTAHGGTLTAASPGRGAGATFSVTLPLLGAV